ncbi:MAG: hypothetical protein ONA90_10960 [candidate division KSB1 bacterium]|nr:hypothetical protein [candidate division KSB1 bacterium]
MKALQQALWRTGEEFFNKLIDFFPVLLAAIIIIFLGLVAAWLMSRIVGRILRLAKFDQRSTDAGLTRLLNQSDIRSSPTELIRRTVWWVIFLIFFGLGLSTLKAPIIDYMITAFLNYLPKIFAAVLILVAGFVMGNFLARAALLAAVNANMKSGRMLSGVVRLLVMLLAFAMAMEQLAIAQSIVVAAFSFTFGGIALALALAFGLGGRELARELLQTQFSPRQQEAPDEFSHI